MKGSNLFKRLFAGILLVFTVFCYSSSPAKAGAITATLGLVASLKQKGIKVEADQEKFVNELDESIEASITKAIETATEEEKKKVKSLEEKAAENQKVINKWAEKAADPPPAFQFKTSGQLLQEDLEKHRETLKNFKEGKGGKGFTVEVKAVGNMSSSGNLTGSYFVPPTVVPGVVTKLYESVHMRNLLPTGTTDSNVIRYIRDNGGEGGPATVAEGGTKPQIDRDLQIYDANVRKIATYWRVPEEMIEDIPYLQSFIVNISLEEVASVEDTQILYGDGTGNNLSGLFTNATAFAAGTSVVAAPNNFDVIGAAKKQARVAKTNGPLIGLVSPVDWYDMRYKTKDTTNNYMLMGGGNGLDIGMNIDGVRILEHTAITAGDFLVFSPQSAQIFDRAATSVRFYDQDQDNAIKNLITIVVEKRLALPIYRTTSIIKGTFATAITDLTS